jgi:formylglycine-generating enzyme required for sulfatase activity
MQRRLLGLFFLFLGALGSGWSKTVVSAPTAVKPAVVLPPVLSQAVRPAKKSPAVKKFSLGLNMIYVPPGSFQYDKYYRDICTVSGFLISQDDITRSQFWRVMGTDPSDRRYSSGSDDPVQMVNWYQAIAFCNKLSLREGLVPVYSVFGVRFSRLRFSDIPTSNDPYWDSPTVNWQANGYRLPTEMEWMWAAMGATYDALRSDFVGGVDRGGYRKAYAGSRESDGRRTRIWDWAWYYEDSGMSTHRVDSKAANELGLHDMTGNVWEWTWDLDGPYPRGPLTNYRGPAFGRHRVLRGASWGSYASACELTRRHGSNPDYQNSIIGFRVVRR